MLRRLALALATTALVVGAARAGDYEQLGRLEREVVDAVLAERGLRVDPAPAGKTVGQVLVVNRDVFAENEGFLQWFNVLHRTTRTEAIAREVLVQPGQTWDQELVDETRRRLSDGDLSNVVVLLPVVAADPEKVDLLVVTRDVWSLRLNTNFEYQGGALLFFTASLSENNLLGWRKSLALVFNLDQGQYSLGPSYQDPNIRGTRLTLGLSGRAIFERETGRHEATSVSGTLAYPLWSLATKWGGSIGASYFEGTVRSFAQGEPLLFPLMPVANEPQVPVVYHQRIFRITTGGVRSFGKDVKQNVRAGHQAWRQRATFLDDFPPDPALRERFATTFFGRNETASGLYAGYRLYTPRYATFRELNVFELREDRQLGPHVDLVLFQALEALGSDRTFQTYAASAGWTEAFLGGLQSAAAGWSARYQGGRLVDQTVSGSAYLATPKLRRLARLVGSAAVATQLDVEALSPIFLGGSDGLRGYAVSEFSGRAYMLTHLELRSMQARILFTRLGMALFWDSGHAAPSLSALEPRHDVGAGLRLLIPQAGPYVIRADWAIPLQDGVRTRAGLPGRISVGFHQVF